MHSINIRRVDGKHHGGAGGEQEGALGHLVRQAGANVNFGRTDNVLMVIRPDQTAELWVDGVAVSLNILAKRDIQAGTAVFESDIADVVGLDFPCVYIGPNDKVFYLFREDWRFALFFDFNPNNGEKSGRRGFVDRELQMVRQATSYSIGMVHGFCNG